MGRWLPWFCLAWGWGQVSSASTVPNFVIIHVDDLGYADIGPFGSKLNATPNLDRMAGEGRCLTNHYAAPVCSPSRASLLTGCYPKRVLPIPHVLFPAAAVGLHPGEVTIAELLKGKGYRTACVGKWHLGDQPGLLPTDQGFDSFFGLPYSNDMGPREDGAKSDFGSEPKPPKAQSNPGGKGDETGLRGDDQPPLPLMRNGTVIERVGREGQASLTRRYTEEAVRFLKEAGDSPFFLYLAHTAVHFPLYPGEGFLGRSKNGLLGDWVEEVDWSTGRIFQALGELGLDARTLVIFTSDNGGTTRSSNAPLRGFKASTWEGGIRVPTIVRWPGRIPAGGRTTAITGHLDWLPTLARLAGAELPPGRVLDGVDLWPALTGGGRPREVFHYFRGAVLEAVREGRWKLHLGPGALYDLEADPGEARDLASNRPAEVERLRVLAGKMEGGLGTTGFGPECRPLGRHPQPRPLLAPDGSIRPGFEPK
ncbi:MAG: sulfatase [Verrucomicrobia bacterium]|nr:sulfatase [Verrucomicrobiota bacterium]